MLAAVVAILMVVGVLAHTAPAPFLLEAVRPGRSLWHVPQAPGQPPTVYLTFDDGPSAEWTPPLLDVLREFDVHATFFLIDEHITIETEGIVRRMADEGHAIALHTGSRGLTMMAPEQLAATLRQAASRIARIAGREPCRMFRPHAGWRSASMYEGLQRAEHTLVGWSWGMWDWSWWTRPDGPRVAARLARKASPGDIIVMHDGHHANPRADRRHAAEAVQLLVPLLRQRGFTTAALCVGAPPQSTEAPRANVQAVR